MLNDDEKKSRKKNTHKIVYLTIAIIRFGFFLLAAMQ